MTYDTNNIFAKILRGEIPCHRIYEDGHSLAIMDVMPQVDGHCLVIPKNASQNLLDAHDADIALVMATVKKVAGAAVLVMKADGFQLRQFNGTAAGQTVFHLHFHILPVKHGDTIKHHSSVMADHSALAQLAKDIAAAL